ncbi:RNA-binding protein [Trypanosoma grayi]|uniref:RNA-binding protein n=1 Tax=Trypanosoma grayi TaxID=71804 RepID=UPI0004F47A33|nr:RNA-binding protein [Trypanosoma grayi]KEG12729.1 RNA-binding protein [Trypanosoma grayi]
MPLDSDPRNLIVNYIPTPVTDAELRQLFEQFGVVESARVIVDRANNNHPKGYGFVKFSSEMAARAAIEGMNGFQIYNKRLRVTPARGPQNAHTNNGNNKLTSLLQARMGSPHSPAASSPSPPSLPCSGGSDMGHSSPITMPMPSFAPYQFMQQLPTSAGSASMTRPTFAIVDGVPVPVFPTSQTIMTAPAGSPCSSALTGFVSQSPANSTNTNHHIMTNATDGGLLNMASQPPRKLEAQQQPAYSAMVQPLYFQPFRPYTTAHDPLIQGSGSSYLTSVTSLDMNSNSGNSKPFGANGAFFVEPTANILLM